MSRPISWQGCLKATVFVVCFMAAGYGRAEPRIPISRIFTMRPPVSIRPELMVELKPPVHEGDGSITKVSSNGKQVLILRRPFGIRKPLLALWTFGSREAMYIDIPSHSLEAPECMDCALMEREGYLISGERVYSIELDGKMEPHGVINEALARLNAKPCRLWALKEDLIIADSECVLTYRPASDSCLLLGSRWRKPEQHMLDKQPTLLLDHAFDSSEGPVLIIGKTMVKTLRNEIASLDEDDRKSYFKRQVPGGYIRKTFNGMEFVDGEISVLLAAKYYLLDSWENRRSFAGTMDVGRLEQNAVRWYLKGITVSARDNNHFYGHNVFRHCSSDYRNGVLCSLYLSEYEDDAYIDYCGPCCRFGHRFYLEANGREQPRDFSMKTEVALHPDGLYLFNMEHGKIWRVSDDTIDELVNKDHQAKPHRLEYRQVSDE